MKRMTATVLSFLLVATLSTPAQSAGTDYSVYQKTLAAFSSSATNLSTQQKAQVRAAVEANPSAEKFICTGIRYFSQPMRVNIMVRKRAKSACEYAKQLNPNLSTWFQNKPTRARSYAGKVLLTVKSPLRAVEECDPSLPHSKGAFEFDPQVDESLPQSWRTEFAVILANLQAVAPISPCLHELRETSGEFSAKSPMKIYAWQDVVDNPWEAERPGMEGMSVSGDGTDTWMVLEIEANDFASGSLHIYSVVAHEYWHVYQRATWMGFSPPNGDSWPVWIWEGGAKTFEELYSAQHYGRSEFDNNLFPVAAAALSDPSDFKFYSSDGGAVGGESDRNYNSSAFMVLALAKELQERQGLSEAESLALVLTSPDPRGSETPFMDVFGMTLEDFYTSLAQYPAVQSGQAWFTGNVIDASVVMPSKGLTLEEILQPAG